MRLGLHGIFARGLSRVTLTLSFIVALWVQIDFSFVASLTFFITAFLLITGTAARFGPLEPKAE